MKRELLPGKYQCSSFLVLIVLGLCFTGCEPSATKPRYFNFEEYGEINLPESFQEKEYLHSHNYERLTGVMSIKDAKDLVAHNHQFKPQSAGRNPDFNALIASFVGPVYQIKKVAERPHVLIHVNVETGDFDGFVSF